MGFPGISWRTHDGNGLKLCMLLYPGDLQQWLDYDHGLVIFLILPLFWLSETGQIWGFRPFREEPIDTMAWKFACWIILTTFRTDQIRVMVCWFFKFWCYFDLLKCGKFGVFQAFPGEPIEKMAITWGFWSGSEDFPHYGAPLTETGHIWGFWALSG